MTVAIYARVSSNSHETRGNAVGAQLTALRHKMSEFGYRVIHEYIDDGGCGAQLDRPGLDALRDDAKAGLFKQVWCVAPDRLTRSHGDQVLMGWR